MSIHRLKEIKPTYSHNYQVSLKYDIVFRPWALKGGQFYNLIAKMTGVPQGVPPGSSPGSTPGSTPGEYPRGVQNGRI